MALRYKFLLFFMMVSIVSFGQSFFKPVPKPPIHRTIIADSIIPDVFKNELRPELNLLSYSLPDNSLLTGIGVSYQHLKWDATVKKWKSQWSGNFLIWNKSSLEGKPAKVAVGGALGILNNLILIGIATDFDKVFPTVGLGINLNN